MMKTWQSMVTIMAVAAAAPLHAAPVLSADARLQALYTAEYAWRQSVLGPDEDNKDAPPGLPDVGPATQAAKLARWTRTLAALDTIRVADLAPAQQVNYAVYRQQIVALLNEQKFREYEKPLNSDTSFWGNVAEAARGDFVTERDYRNYLLMLRSIPHYFDQNIANMRAGLKRGFTPPRITLQGRDTGVAQVIDAGASEASPFYAPLKAMHAAIPAATQATLRAEALTVIRDAVVPAHRTLPTFLRNDYMPHASIWA